MKTTQYRQCATFMNTAYSHGCSYNMHFTRTHQQIR